MQSRTAKDVIRRLKLRFASEAQADVENDPTVYDWKAAGAHCLHLFSCAPGKVNTTDSSIDVQYKTAWYCVTAFDICELPCKGLLCNAQICLAV